MLYGVIVDIAGYGGGVRLGLLVRWRAVAVAFIVVVLVVEIAGSSSAFRMPLRDVGCSSSFSHFGGVGVVALATFVLAAVDLEEVVQSSSRHISHDGVEGRRSRLSFPAPPTLKISKVSIEYVMPL